MYAIYDRLSEKYYTGITWDSSIKSALLMTKLRAEEMVESLRLKAMRGWESGEYEMIEVK